MNSAEDLQSPNTLRFCDLVDAPAHTKIVGTIGPASAGRLPELIDAGLSVARINFSHGKVDDYRRWVQDLRQLATERGTEIGILADIQGPKLRLGRFPGGVHRIRRGEVVRLVRAEGTVHEDEIPLDFDGVENVEEGHRVFLADGVVELLVTEAGEGGLRARCRRGGSVGDRRGVHLPDTAFSFEVPTEQDVRDLQLAAELGVDMVGVSFVSRGEELDRVRELVPEASIVAKIERAIAIQNLEGILAKTDGIMVARGDLGVEIPLEQLPLMQKSLIHDALRAGRFTITATEMLESMVQSSRPTRAEVADVANAVLDGTDAVMLSAETAVGEFPVEAVATMGRIARTVEASQRYSDLPRVGFRSAEPNFSNATALAAAKVADALDVAKIVCFTETGNTVRQISRYRPRAEVLALSPHRSTLRHITILAHVRPLHFQRYATLDDMMENASTLLIDRGLVREGDQVVFVAGVPPGVASSTNVMKLHRIGDPVRLS